MDLLRKLLVAGLSLVAILLLMELGLGLYDASQQRALREAPEPYYPWSFDTSDGERIGGKGYLQLAMNPAAIYLNLPQQKTPYFTTNSEGFRGPERAHAAGSSTIVVVGGSTAFGTGLQSDEDAFPARLAEAMKRVEVINAAVIGHLSGQELGFLVSELVDLKPDLVIALDGFNDLIDQVDGPQRTRRTAAVNNTFFLMQERLRNLYLLESGGLFARMSAALPVVFKNLARVVARSKAAGDLPDSHSDEPPEPADGAWIGRDPKSLARIYAANIAKMKTVTTAFGGRFLCLLQADSSLFRPPAKMDAIGVAYLQFRKEALQRLREAGVEAIDLNEHREAFEKRMFMDRIHLNAAGNRVMAQLVEQVIEERELLERN